MVTPTSFGRYVIEIIDKYPFRLTDVWQMADLIASNIIFNFNNLDEDVKVYIEEKIDNLRNQTQENNKKTKMKI